VDEPAAYAFPDAGFVFDAVGNRTQATAGGVVNAYLSNILNQYTKVGVAPYTYDVDGNLTSDGAQAYVYDVRNRLTQVKLPSPANTVLASFGYDWSNRLNTKTVNNVLTRFGYDGAEAIHQLVGTVKTTYTYGPGLDEVLLQEQGTTALYLLRDGLNSTIAATNATGAVVERYAYDAYGQVQVQNAARQPVATAPQTPWLFTGRYYHAESKFYDFRNRVYQPAIGRFMQVDPIGFWGGVNLYGYVANRPLRSRDPHGFDFWIEGPSPGEPAGHQSIVVGNPNGQNSAYSFGVNGSYNLSHGMEGEVYRDPIGGGEINPELYRKTTAREDEIIRKYLEGLVGQRDSYGPWRTCRNWSQEQFRKFAAMGLGKSSAPPQRLIPTDYPATSVPFASSTVRSGEPYGPVSRGK